MKIGCLEGKRLRRRRKRRREMKVWEKGENQFSKREASEKQPKTWTQSHARHLILTTFARFTSQRALLAFVDLVLFLRFPSCLQKASLLWPEHTFPSPNPPSLLHLCRRVKVQPTSTRVSTHATNRLEKVNLQNVVFYVHLSFFFFIFGVFFKNM